jgi:hypothetical protein
LYWDFGGLSCHFETLNCDFEIPCEASLRVADLPMKKPERRRDLLLFESRLFLLKSATIVLYPYASLSKVSLSRKAAN